MGEPGMK